MEDLIIELRKELIGISDKNVRRSGERYFKENVILYGIKSAVVHRISRDYFKKIEGADKHKIFGFCDLLWESGIVEESIIACNWSYYIHRDYKPGDLDTFEKWVKYRVNNWASCDTLCNHTVGTIVEMYPSLVERLKDWARSSGRWTRRAAAVSLIIPARKGKFHGDILEIADILHSDGDDMVRKGYGWMLKAASQARQKEIFDYIMAKKDTMPRTALRYAIEKMSPELKEKAMSK